MLLRAVKLVAALAALSLASAANAQEYPKRPISMIVPFAAGGTSDVIARVVAEEMAKSLGQPIVIENVAGAGGSTALTRAARLNSDDADRLLTFPGQREVVPWKNVRYQEPV